MLALFAGLLLCMNIVAADCINVYVKDNNGNARSGVAINLDYYWSQGVTNNQGYLLIDNNHLINTGITNYWHTINAGYGVALGHSASVRVLPGTCPSVTIKW